jgi:N-acetylmuramoyl-L-alanine amidase
MSLKQNRNQGSSITTSTGLSTSGKKMGRIVDIIMSTEHPAYISSEDTPLGTIFFTPIGFHTEVTNKNATYKAKPLSINNITYPLIGEIVMLVEEIPVGNDYYDDLEGDVSSTEYRYGGTVSVHNNSSNNALPTQANSRKSKPKRSSNVGNDEVEETKLGGYFKENADLNPLAPGEGDSIMEGKNGQRIRFTTTGPTGTNAISNGVTDDPDDGNPSIGDKAMVLSLGNGSQENVTNDAASIYMLENQSLPIDATSTNIDSLNSTYEPLVKPLEQISAKPAQVIPQTLSSEELVIQPINFNISAPVVERKAEQKQEQPSIDPNPVFAALDEAQEEGLLRFDMESIEIAGTEYDEEVENQPDVSQPTEDDGSAAEAAIQGDYVQINIKAAKTWKSGGIGFFKNKSGKTLRLGKPDRTLSMKKTNKRDIKYLVIHTAGCASSWNAADLTRFFFNDRDVPNDGGPWNTGGYHWIIDQEGNPTRIYDDKVTTNGAKGINPKSIHLTWTGGYSPEYDAAVAAKQNPIDLNLLNFNITKIQILRLKQLIKRYIETYPDIKVLGHNQVSNKPCPLFNVPTFLQQIDVDRDNIERRVGFANRGFYARWEDPILKQEARRLALLV